jgi:simple sugar transport system ATP-binding protein
MNDMAIIDVKGLVKIYGDGTVALNNVDFSYNKRSSTIVLVGPNGAGKTAFLKNTCWTLETYKRTR